MIKKSNITLKKYKFISRIHNIYYIYTYYMYV